MTPIPAFRFIIVIAAALAASAVSAAEKPVIRHRDVTYAQPDAKSPGLRAEVYVPGRAGRHPGVLVIHGGAWCVGSRHQLGRAAAELAAHGYTAVAIDYRLAPKYKFPAQLDDCCTAVRWMRENAAKYRIDPERIGAYGYSAGGHLAALLGVSPVENGAGTASGSVQAVVAGGAPCDFETLPAESEMFAFFLGGTRQAQPDTYRRASPKALVGKGTPPMFLFHGQSDLIVPISSSRQMAAALKQAGVTHELLIVPRIGHVATCYNDAALAASIKFLDEHLRAKSR
jgi:acetyl esterase/lipase